MAEELDTENSRRNSAVKVENPKRTTPPTNMPKKRGSEVLAKKKKNSSAKLKPSSDLNINSLQLDIKKDMPAVQNKTSAMKLKLSSDLIRSPESPKIIRGQIPLLSKKFQVSLKHLRSNSRIMKDGEMIISSLKSSPGPKAKSVMGSPFSSPTASSGSNGTSKTDIMSGELTGTSKTAMGKVLTTPTASLSSKPCGTRIISPYPRKYSSLKLVFPSMDQYRKGKADSKKPINDKVQVKTLHVVDASSENKKLEPMQSDGTIQISPSTSPLPQSPMKPIDDNAQVKTLHVVEAATEDKPVQSDDTVQISQSTSPVSQLPLKLTDNDVQVKTLHVVEPATENKILELVQTDSINKNSPSTSPVFKSPVSSPSHGDKAEEHEFIDVKDVEHSGYSDGEYSEYSEYTDTYDSEESEYAESETDEFISENTDKVNTPKGNYKRSTRKGRQLTSEDKDSDMTKAKFRRGRIVDLQSENDAPRKLKFRRGRVVENEDGSKTYVRRRIFKKREVAGDVNGANGDSEQVVLRHQEQQEKVEQGLYNDVIEETATKLADLRKSKVRALVGAFETVIHLQDKTPQES